MLTLFEELKGSDASPELVQVRLDWFLMDSISFKDF